MRALVTGAAGFIGSNLVDRLLTDGHHVVAVDNFRTGCEENLVGALDFSARGVRRFTLIDLDIQAPELGDVIIGANPDVVFHLAARDDCGEAPVDAQLDARTNVLGTINLCEASGRAGVQRIVYAASGVSRYGTRATGLDETDTVEPRSPHGVAKLAGEMYLRAYAEEFGMSPICLALANVYGPRQGRRGEAGLVAVLGTALITGSPFMINRGAADAHDFVYVDDVVEAFLRAADAPDELTGTYNIGTGRRTTASEVYRLISAVLDGTPVGSCADIDVDESPALTLNSEKASRAFDWKPQIDLAEGVRRTIDWLCDVLESEGSAIAACDPGAA